MVEPTGHERIIMDSGMFGGKPILRGTRITVELIEDWISSGIEPGEILADYPNLTSDDIDAAIRFARGARGTSAGAR